MKKIKYILMFFLSLTMLMSCFKDDESTILLNDDGNNVAGFTNARENVAAIADGSEYAFNFKMKIAGPTLLELTSDVDITIEATAASTAVEGVHYRLDNPNATFTKGENYLSQCEVTMLSTGIVAPLAKSPILVLKAVTATGEKFVVASGKPVEITLNYACPSYLEGSYDVTLEYWRKGEFLDTYTYTDYFTETGLGAYRTTRIGHWSISSLGGTPGFTFYDVCGTITIPEQSLVDTYSNVVEGVAGASSVDPVTGNIYMEYTIITSDAPVDRLYKATYVKN